MAEEVGAAHIVVVDDEPDLREAVQEYLLDHGFAVSGADGGRSLRSLMSERAVDLVILDINMPEEDGLSIARYLRGLGPIGIIMLTANRDTVDRVVGLEIGADDYLPKPFELRELLARVRAVLRRVAKPHAPAATMAHEVRVGRCMLNLESRRLFDLEGGEVPITAMEFDLLRTFVEHPNRVLTRDQLLDLAHNMEMTPFDRSIDMRIGRLRRKVEPDPKLPRTLKTVRGAGYIFVPAAISG
ncbi:response regulator [Sphingomonas arenae]|uniref:response regulator n=1 Tax=Sphingomonas arenae TaxID=2812555 RepID=UPI001968A14B|nr:response regulator [Sphingomonas arenae]